MKTLLAGIVLGVAAKCLWDSQYGDELRESIHQWWTEVLNITDEKIVRAETAIENTAEKVDRGLNN